MILIGGITYAGFARFSCEAYHVRQTHTMSAANHPDLTALLARVERQEAELERLRGELKPPRTRRTKADRFPMNLKIIVEAVLIPEDVEANPND